MSARDTQFAGFARALLDEIESVSADYSPPPGRYITGSPKWEEVVRGIIARRAYDLVEHTLDACDQLESDAGLESHGFTSDYLLSSIPDLTTWPEETK